jgi:putative two-component system response regulator
MNDDKRRIMVVDDDITNLNVCVLSLMDDYDVMPATSVEKMFKLLSKVRPEIILLDVEMPGVDGFEAIRRLKEDPVLAGIPVVFVTATADPEKEVEGIKLGAVDFITKPYSRALLMKRVSNHLELEDHRRGRRPPG